jgi:hypothetical protein
MGAQQWPFVGREDLLGVLQALLSVGATRGVVIDGPAGIGKTRLADEFTHSLSGVGIARVVGSPTTHSTPYGSIAHLLPSDLPADHERDARAVLNALRTQLGPGRAVFIADDVVFLDDSTVSLLAHLLALNEVFLVGTVRSDHVVPPGLDSLIRSYGLHRLSLAPLDDQSIARAAEVVIGAPLEPISAQRLVARSGGNPLYVRELLLQSLATQSIELLPSGAVRLDIDVSSVPRLVEVVGHRLAAVPAPLLPLLQMIAIAEPLMLADLERAGLADDAVQLEQRGWIRADPRGAAVEIRVAHPLHSEVLRASMGTIEYRRQVARAAEVLRQRPTPERDDSLRIALWELDAGLQPSGPVLLDGARRARAAVDLHSALRLVEAAYHADPSQAARHIWLEVLFLLSRFEEAEEVAARPVTGDPDLRLTVSTMMLRMDNLLWGVGDSRRAIELVHSFRPEFAAIGIDFLLAIPEAFIRGVDGQSARALELLGPVPDDPQIFLLASLAQINARMWRGRFDEVEALCQRGLDILDSFADPRGSMDPIFFRLNRGMARNLSGRSAEVYAEFVLAYGSVVEERQAFMRCFVGFVTGQAALNQGFLESADQWFAETEVRHAGAQPADGPPHLGGRPGRGGRATRRHRSGSDAPRAVGGAAARRLLHACRDGGRAGVGAALPRSRGRCSRSVACRGGVGDRSGRTRRGTARPGGGMSSRRWQVGVGPDRSDPRRRGDRGLAAERAAATGASVRRPTGWAVPGSCARAARMRRPPGCCRGRHLGRHSVRARR